MSMIRAAMWRFAIAVLMLIACGNSLMAHLHNHSELMWQHGAPNISQLYYIMGFGLVAMVCSVWETK